MASDSLYLAREAGLGKLDRADDRVARQSIVCPDQARDNAILVSASS